MRIHHHYRQIAVISLFLLLLPSVMAPSILDSFTSPLTDPKLNWDGPMNRTTLGLPWYGVEDWEVDVCTRGLSTSMGYDPKTNQVTEQFLLQPIYMDTITILAKRTPMQGVENADYYEIGWYVQPYERAYDAKVTIYDGAGKPYVLAAGSASSSLAFDGYKAFPIPCDTTVYGSACIPLTSAARVKLEWTIDNQTQFLVTQFIETAEESR